MKLTLPLRAALFPGLIMALLARADPPGALPLADALESGGMQWRTGSESPWFGTATASHDGADSGRSGGSGSGESWLEADITGPAALNFWLKADTGNAKFLLNNAGPTLARGDWQQRRLRLGPGTQRLRFLAHAGAPSGGSTGADAFFVDEVQVTPSAGVSIGESADATGLTWQGSPGAFGFSESGEGISGGDVVVVQGQGTAPGAVWTEVSGPAAVRFRWKMTGAVPQTKLTVTSGSHERAWSLPEDGADVSRGAESWFDAEVLVAAGPQEVRWTPDAAGDFLLDAVSVVPSPVAGVAVGQPNLTWTGDWLTRAAEHATGGSVAVTPLLAPGQQATLSTSITGPAEVTYLSSLLLTWDGSPLHPMGTVTVRVDGEEGTARSVEEADGWYRTTVFVPEGPHSLTWMVENTDTVAPSYVTRHLQGVLDDVRIAPVAPAGLTEALKTTLAPQVTGGAALSGRWRGFTSLTSGMGGRAAVCGPLAEGEETTLTLPVAGPARLMLSLRGERWSRSRGLNFSAQLDGAEVLDNSAVTGDLTNSDYPLAPDWRTLEIPVPSGAHTLTLRASADSPGALLWLDAIGYLPADPGEGKIAAAVGMPGTLWRRISQPGRGAWRYLSTPMALEGHTLAACTGLPAGKEASVETTITGPGTLDFSWGLPHSGALRASMDGTLAYFWEPNSPYYQTGERAEFLLPAGPHTVRWTYTADWPPEPSPEVVQAWLDRVRLTPSPAASSPAPGLDVTAAVTTDSDWPWRTVAPEFSATGDGEAATVEVPANGSAWLEMPVTGPGRFAFWWRGETYIFHAKTVALAVDGIETAWLPDKNDWYRSEVTVGPGAHTLRWLVNSSGDSPARRDACRVWLDGFTQLPVLPLADALDAPALTWTTGAPSLEGDFTDWTGLPAAETAGNPGTDDAAVTAGTRPLTTQVTGPGIVTFRWAEKTVPPLPVVIAPPVPPSPSSPVVIGGGALGLVMNGVGWWDWNWWQPPPPPRAVFAVNGVSRATLDLSEDSFDSALATHTIHLGAGTHTLTWQRTTRSDGRRLVVESVSFTATPDAFAPVAAELGVPVSDFTMNNVPWIVQNTQSHDGTAALQSGSTTNGASTLEMEFTGPGELSFWWKANGSADFRDITNGETINVLIIGGVQYGYPVTAYHAPVEWQRFTWSVGSGLHRYSWRANANATLWLDEVTFSTPQPLPGPNAVAEALDFNELTWNAPGWQPMTGGGLRDTGDALVGPEYGGAGDPWLETTVTGPATLFFDVWSETLPPAQGRGGGATVKIFLDGVEVNGLTIPEGSHTLRIVFPSGTAPGRRPVMDDVRMAVPVGEALGQPSMTWINVSNFWKGWRSDRYPGHGTWIESNGQLFANITGPVLISVDVLLPPVVPQRSGYGVLFPPATVGSFTLEIDNRVMWRGATSAGGWQTIHAAAGPGQHVLVFRNQEGPVSKLDNVVITPDPAPQPTLADAFDSPGRTFSHTGGWKGVRNAATGGHDDTVLDESSGTATLETGISGPAWVSFDYMLFARSLELKLDGARVTILPSPSPTYEMPLVEPWKSHRVFVPGGSHTLAWHTAGSGPGSSTRAQLDSLVITPLGASQDEVPLAEALDAPGLTFTTEGSAIWSGRHVTEGTGGDAAIVYGGQSGTLKTTVTGPGTLAFRCKHELLSDEYDIFGPPDLRLELDGQAVVGRGSASPATWQTVEWPVPQGTHEIGWSLNPYGGLSVLMVDEVRMLPAVSLTDALDAPAGLTFSLEGTPIAAMREDGSDEVFLQQVNGAAPPGFSTTVTGPGELSFDWRHTVSGGIPMYEDSWPDFLSIDGQTAGYWMPAVPGGYNRAFIAVGAGQHVIRWTTSMNAYIGVWLDGVTWSGGLPAWAQAAGGTDSNGVNAWITGGKVPWTAALGAGINNGAAAGSSGGWLQAIVPPGPGTLCWWGRTGDGVNGSAPYFGLYGPGVTGFHSADWHFSRSRRRTGQMPQWGASGESFVTGVSFTPAATVPLAQALDAPAVVFETSPDAPWSGVVTDGAALGAAAAVCGESGFTKSWVRASFTGPGRLNFSWRLAVTGHTVADPSRVLIDAAEAARFPDASFAWARASLWLEAGAHTVKWETAGLELWIDAVQFTPTVSVGLAAALEYTGAPWTAGGTGTWRGLGPLPDTIGDDAAVSPALLENEEAWTETTVPGSGILTWRWRLAHVQTEGDFDFLLDGLPLTKLSYSRGHHSGWQADRWELPAGSHTLRWRYRAAAAGEGQALLDDVAFTPGPPPAWESALGVQTIPIGGGGSEPWLLLTEGGVSFLRNELEYSLPDGSLRFGGSAIFADITGPAMLHYKLRGETDFYLAVDEVEEHVIRTGTAWSDEQFFIPSGRHRLRWNPRTSTYSLYHRQLDIRDFKLTPLATVPLAEAVDSPGLVFTPVAGDWTGWHGGDAHDGGDFIQVSRTTLEPVSLTLSLTGPGVLRWWWRDDRPGVGHSLTAQLDGSQVARADPSAFVLPTWQPAAMAVPPGEHTIAFNVSTSGALGVLGALDGFVWRPTSATTTLANAAEGTGLSNWTTGAPGDWFPVEDPALAFDGRHSLVAPRVPATGLRRLRATAEGPGTLSFVEGLRFPPQIVSYGVTVDGVNGGGPFTFESLNDGWFRQMWFTGEAGTHQFEWTRPALNESSTDLDVAVLDNITFTPSAPVPLATALDQPGWTFRTGGPHPWTGGTSPTGVNGHLAYAFVPANPPDAPESWIETDITGPGALFSKVQFGYTRFSFSVDGVTHPREEPAFLAAGPHTVRWAVRQDSFAADATVTLDNLEWLPGTWAGWVSHHFPAGTPAARTAFDADPDSDGLPNGVEAILATSPLRPDNTPPLAWRTVPVEYPEISFTSTLFPPDGITIAIESAASLAGPWTTQCQRTTPGDWNSGCFSGASQPTESRISRYFRTSPGPARFYRLRVTKSGG